MIFFRFLLTLSLVLNFSLGAQETETPKSSIRWDLQVTDPQFDLVNYKLEGVPFKPYLKKTSWRCEVSETEKKGKLEIKNLFCDYSVEKAGTVKTAVSCSPQRKYSEAYLELFDEKKNLTFQVMLTCNVIEVP